MSRSLVGEKQPSPKCAPCIAIPFHLLLDPAHCWHASISFCLFTNHNLSLYDSALPNSVPDLFLVSYWFFPIVWFWILIKWNMGDLIDSRWKLVGIICTVCFVQQLISMIVWVYMRWLIFLFFFTFPCNLCNKIVPLIFRPISPSWRLKCHM